MVDSDVTMIFIKALLRRNRDSYEDDGDFEDQEEDLLICEPTPKQRNGSRHTEIRGCNGNRDGKNCCEPASSSVISLKTSSQSIEMKVLQSQLKTGSSVDSSDTYASCQTHPFVSQEELESNVYVNPLENPQQRNNTDGGHSSTSWNSSPKHKTGYYGPTPQQSITGKLSVMKTSRSGEGDAIKLASPARARRARFQQQLASVTKINESMAVNKYEDKNHEFGGSVDSLTQMERDSGRRYAARDQYKNNTMVSSNNPTEELKKRRPSFLPTKAIASSASKLINHHIFGSKSLDQGKKPILKNKGVPTHYHAHNNDSDGDAETERLLDNCNSSSRSDSCSSGTSHHRPLTTPAKSVVLPKSPLLMSTDKRGVRSSSGKSKEGERDCSRDTLARERKQKRDSSDSSTLSPSVSNASTVVSRHQTSTLPPPPTVTPTPSCSVSKTQESSSKYDDLLFADCSPNE